MRILKASFKLYKTIKKGVEKRKCWQKALNNKFMLIIIQNNDLIRQAFLKKKLFLRHNFETERND